MKTKTILLIQASARGADSVSRDLACHVAEQRAAATGAEIVTRDVSGGLPVIDAAWVKATFTPPETRDDEDRAALAFSDTLVSELLGADEIVIGTPIYNFGVPGSLKLWADLIARAGVTFRYTENGPEGLLNDRPAHIVVASGGVPVDSAADFATPWLRQILSFVGIEEVTVHAADGLNRDPGKAERIRAEIEALAA